MAKRHDININITADGKVELEVKGVDGPLCLDITRELEQELGVVVNREKTSEYYKQPDVTEIKINGKEL